MSTDLDNMRKDNYDLCIDELKEYITSLNLVCEKYKKNSASANLKFRLAALDNIDKAKKELQEALEFTELSIEEEK